MKLLIMSDLHFDYNSRYVSDVVQQFIDYLNTLTDVQYVLVAGDISSYANRTVAYVDKIEKATGKKILFVPGNHDVWATESDSLSSYRLMKEHPSCLCDNPHVIGDYVVIGDIGWYDYTFGPKTVNVDQFRIYKKHLWCDAQYVLTKYNDVQLTDIMLAKLKKRIEAYPNKKIIILTHTVPFEHYITHMNDDSWEICNGYIGSKRLGDLFKKYDNIKYVINGHTHFKFETVQLGNITSICNPFGYFHEWQDKNPTTEFKEQEIIIEI